jgi:hypothetical protein
MVPSGRRPCAAVIGTHVLLALNAPLSPLVALHLVVQLVQRDGHQQPPKVPPLLEGKSAVARRHKKAAVHRLHHVLGVDTRSQFLRQSLPGQLDQAGGIAVKELRRRVLIPLAKRDSSRQDRSTMGAPGNRKPGRTYYFRRLASETTFSQQAVEQARRN